MRYSVFTAFIFIEINLFIINRDALKKEKENSDSLTTRRSIFLSRLILEKRYLGRQRHKQLDDIRVWMGISYPPSTLKRRGKR